MSKPNILLIFSDQHRFDCVGANGHALVKTPNMDRLAAEGANFTHAFSPVPMCVPARCSLLTGQWPSRHGVVFNYDGETFKRLDADVPTFTSAVQRAGYRTVHIGRWNVDQQRTAIDYGCHDFVPDWRYGKWRSAKGLPPVPRDQGWRGQVDRYARPEESSLAWGADQVIRYLGVCRQETDPFCIQWHMVEPHPPCCPPEPYASMCAPEGIPPWLGFDDGLHGKPLIQRQMRLNWGVDGMPWGEWQPTVARYFGVISLLDNQIGRVLDALERLHYAENTLVVYTSDHGDMCGSHGMVDKHYVMYDDVVRVPLIMRWPGTIPTGRTVDDFAANSLDLASTFCEVAGAKTPETFQGESLVGAATGTRSTDRSDIFSVYSGNQFGAYSSRMVRDRRWKYVWNATAEDELYDLQADPGETTSRIADPVCRKQLVRLRTRLIAWMEQTHDALLNPWVRKQIGEGLKAS
jgi:arylsulfatase A-like enzyme